MLDLQPLRQFSNARAHIFRKALQCEHELMLARLKSGLASSFLAEVEKTPNLISQLR
jgi:hypothetical protein